MGTAFLYGNGGGSSLNFKVVGGATAPESPKDNTIWVETATEISGWVISPVEPVEAADGTVWISTGTSSPVEFNALRKNELRVCPLEAKQRIGGVWEDVTARSWQDGAWKAWRADIELVKNGVVLDSYSLSGFTQRNGYISLEVASGYKEGNGFIKPHLNIDGYKTLKIDALLTGGNSTGYYIGLKSNETNGKESFAFVASGGYSGNEDDSRTIAINLNGQAGNYYFAAYTKSGQVKPCTIKIINATLCL